MLSRRISPWATVIAAIDCHRIARIARAAGSPIDKCAGLDLFHKVGDRVAKGDALYRIHAHFEADFKFATDYAVEDDGYRIEYAPTQLKSFACGLHIIGALFNPERSNRKELPR